MRLCFTRASVVLILALSAALIAPVANAALAAPAITFRDLRGHWAEENIRNWLQTGLAGGYGDGTFRPDKAVNRAEFISFLNRAFGYIAEGEIAFRDVNSTDWFYTEVARGIKAGYVSGFADGTFRPYAPVSRIDAAELLYTALKLHLQEFENLLVGYQDIEFLSAEQQRAANALVCKSLMVGAEGRFSPLETITRAETIAILDRSAGEIFNSAAVYGPAMSCLTINRNATVSVAGVVLQNMVIKGDLYLTEGIGDGDVTLNNVIVKGDTIIAGGGPSSVTFSGASHLQNTIIVDPYGAVRLVFLDDSYCNSLLWHSGGSYAGRAPVAATLSPNITGGSTVTLEGSFTSVDVHAPLSALALRGSTVSNLISHATSAIALTERTRVESLTVEHAAAGTQIYLAECCSIGILTANAAVEVAGAGSVYSVTINAEGVIIAGEEVSGKTPVPVVEEPPLPVYEPPVYTPPPTIRVRSVSINEESQSLRIGSPLMLTAAIEPANATNTSVYWSSSDSSIAEVNGSGLVTALAEGTAIITVTSAADSRRTASVEITVIPVYTVTFMDHYGTVLVTEVVEQGSTLSPPVGPGRTGYSLIGWCKDEALTDLWDFAVDKLTADITLYPLYAANTNTPYSVEHYWQNVSGSGHALAETDYLAGTTDTTAIAEPNVYTGFVENAVHSERAAAGNIAGDGSLTLKLFYDRETYTVSFNTQGGSEVDDMLDVRYRSTVNAPDAPTFAGYTFVSWNTEEGGTGNNYAAGAGFLVTADTTLYAIWVPTAYTVNFSVNEGEGALTARVDGEDILSGASVLEGKTVTFTAAPATGSEVVCWRIGGVAVPGNWTTSLTLTLSAHAQVAVEFATEFAGGLGTAESPWQISEARHLNNVRKYLSAHFVLVSNIDLSAYLSEGGREYNGGLGWRPIGTTATGFSGRFNGNGHIISSLYINRSAEDSVGLFGRLASGAQVEGLGLMAVDVTGRYYTGGLVGYSLGTITTSYATGAVQGDRYCGGLVGYISQGNISNTYSSASVSGASDFGGLVGYSVLSSISNSYSVGPVSRDGGGFIGGSLSSAFASCYWDMATSGQIRSAGGTVKTTSQMQQKSTYTGWDFETIWHIDGGYPFLR
jgi:hypothetical protein